MKVVLQGSVRKSAAALACLALTGVYLVHTHAYAPRVEETRNRESRLQALLEGNRRRDDDPKPDRTALDRRLASHEQLAGQLEALIPSGDEVPALMEAVAVAERRAGVEMTMFRPEPPEPHQPYELWSYQVAVRGTYHAIGSYIAAIASLDHVLAAGDMIMAAEITASDAAGNQQVTVVASFRMRIRVKIAQRGGSPATNERM